jgi:hypothetical protein
MDSGASSHVTGDYHHFDNLQPSSSFQEVRTAGGESHEVRGSRPSTIKTQTGEIKLANVKYVPSLKKNLISVGTINDSGNHLVFTNSHCHVLDEPFIASDHRIVASGHRSPINGMYSMSDKLY